MKLQYAVPVLQYSSTVLDHLRCQDVDRDAGTMEHLEYFEWVDEKPEAHYHVPNSLWMPNELNQILARARLIQCDCPSPTDSKNQISMIPISHPNIPMLVLNFPRSQYPNPNIPMLVLNFPRSRYPNILNPNPNSPMLVLNFPRSQYPNPNIPMLVLNFP